MTKLSLAAFSLSGWFSSAWRELTCYFDNMSTNQWGIIASATVAFGFLCLRGYDIHK